MITGKGIFCWDATERRTDRYGSFSLDVRGYDGNGFYLDASWHNDPVKMCGVRVKITAEILVSRDSAHAGDHVRGIVPTRPETGETIVLGIGEFFAEPATWNRSGYSVGVRPSDGRSNDWFEPEKLYRLHDQTVLITITETDEADIPYKGKVEPRGDDMLMVVMSEGNGSGYYQIKNRW